MSVNRSQSKQEGEGEPTPVLGLTKPQLRPIVEKIAGEAVASFDVRIEHQITGHHGYGGAKVIPTFAYLTRSVRAGEATAFVKALGDGDRTEMRNYLALTALGAPVPKPYGIVVSSDGLELIFLEYVNPVGECMPFPRFCADPDRLGQFLAALARFNAVRPDGDHAAALTTRTFRGPLEKVPATMDALWERTCAGELGLELKRLCRRRRDALGRLQALALELIEQVAAMETGLCHNDIAPDGVGWRDGSDEALILDLESVGFAPRFADVAEWGGSPEGCPPLCAPRRELAEHYLAHYTRAGGGPATISELLDESRTLWTAQTLAMLWFSLHRALDGRVDFTQDPAEGRRVYRKQLAQELTGLLMRLDGKGDMT